MLDTTGRRVHPVPLQPLLVAHHQHGVGETRLARSRASSLFGQSSLSDENGKTTTLRVTRVAHQAAAASLKTRRISSYGRSFDALPFLSASCVQASEHQTLPAATRTASVFSPPRPTTRRTLADMAAHQPSLSGEHHHAQVPPRQTVTPAKLAVRAAGEVGRARVQLRSARVSRDVLDARASLPASTVTRRTRWTRQIFRPTKDTTREP